MSYIHHVRKTSDLSADDIKEINFLFHFVFGTKTYPDNYFKWKYIDNPFGDSIHILTYDSGKLVASRVFWNLPILDDHYQCVDTVVHPEYQGKGIFKETIQLAKQLGIFFYNAPNSNSYPQYISNGWVDNLFFKPKITLLSNVVDHVCLVVDSVFFRKLIQWKFLDCPLFDYCYFFSDGFYYFCRVKKGVPVVLFKAQYIIEGFRKIRKPVVVCFYGFFDGFGIEFSVLTRTASYSNKSFDIKPFFLDMF